MQEKFLTTKESAAFLGIVPRTFRKWKNRGIVKPDKIDGQREYYSENQLRNIKNNNRGTAERSSVLRNQTEEPRNAQNNKTTSENAKTQDENAKTQDENAKRSEKMETNKNNEDLELNRIKDQTAELLPYFLTPAHKNGYICPNCGNGSGNDGTGIDVFKNNPHVVGKCFKCGKSFDIFQIAQQTKNLSFKEAVNWCKDLLGMNNDNPNSNVSPKNKTKTAKEQTALSNDFTNNYIRYHTALLDPQNFKAMEYLKTRGLDDIELINRYQIGYDSSKNTIIVPHDKTFYTARAITKSKNNRFNYNPRGSHVSLFNSAALNNSDDFIFVTEGVFDALSLITIGFQAVAVGGVTNYKTLIKALEPLEDRPKFIILFDSDKAGRDNSIFLEKALTNIKAFSANETLPMLENDDTADANKWLQYNANELKSIAAQKISTAKEKFASWTPPLDDIENDCELNPNQRENLFNNSTADLDNANKIVDMYSDKIRFITDLDRWALFEKSVWRVANASKNSTIYPLVNDLYKIMSKNAITPDEKKTAAVFKSKKKIADGVELCKAFPEILIRSKQFNQNPLLLNCPNGIVDLETGKLHPHDSNLLFTQCTGVEYRPGYHSEVVEKFLHSVLPNDDVLAALLIFLGYCLTGSVREDKALFIHGRGRNGKGTLLNALIRCLFDFAVAMRNSILLKNRNFDDGENATPELAKLQYKRLAILDEIPAGRFLDESKFKNLTGGDPFSVRKLHQDPIVIDPTHKFILSGNFLPEIKDARDIAISERLLVIKFEQSFIGAKCDPEIRENMKKPEALTGLLTELVGACLKWQELGRIFEPDAVKVFKQEYLEENDIVGEFIANNCKYSVDLAIPCQDFIKQFRLNSNGGATMSDKAIIAAVEKIEGIKKHKMKYGRVFQGIGWIDERLYTS